MERLFIFKSKVSMKCYCFKKQAGYFKRGEAISINGITYKLKEII